MYLHTTPRKKKENKKEYAKKEGNSVNMNVNINLNVKDNVNLKESARESAKESAKDVTALAVHPFVDIFVAVGSDLQFYKLFKSDPLKVVERVHEGFVWAMEYHPMGEILCTGSVDQSVRFWVREEMKEEKESEDVREDFDEVIPGL